jgi:hypothetical protein
VLEINVVMLGMGRRMPETSSRFGCAAARHYGWRCLEVSAVTLNPVCRIRSVDV